MLNKVTFTGIDNKVKITELENLYKKYPFIEFGFLVSENNTNKNIENRYPSLVMLKGFKKKNIPLSLHVCGKLAREIVQHNNWQPLYELMGEYINLFSRIQLNIAGTKKLSEDITFPEDKQVIIQFNTSNTSAYEMYKSENVVGFQDNSGGTGKTETTWFENNDTYFGYAGGIGEENVIEIINSINKIHTGNYWIDMETKIRTNDKFDIKKCEKICEKIKQNKLI